MDERERVEIRTNQVDRSVSQSSSEKPGWILSTLTVLSLGLMSISVWFGVRSEETADLFIVLPMHCHTENGLIEIGWMSGYQNDTGHYLHSTWPAENFRADWLLDEEDAKGWADDEVGFVRHRIRAVTVWSAVFPLTFAIIVGVIAPVIWGYKMGRGVRVLAIVSAYGAMGGILLAGLTDRTEPWMIAIASAVGLGIAVTGYFHLRRSASA